MHEAPSGSSSDFFANKHALMQGISITCKYRGQFGRNTVLSPMNHFRMEEGSKIRGSGIQLKGRDNQRLGNAKGSAMCGVTGYLRVQRCEDTRLAESTDFGNLPRLYLLPRRPILSPTIQSSNSHDSSVFFVGRIGLADQWKKSMWGNNSKAGDFELSNLNPHVLPFSQHQQQQWSTRRSILTRNFLLLRVSFNANGTSIRHLKFSCRWCLLVSLH